MSDKSIDEPKRWTETTFGVVATRLTELRQLALDLGVSNAADRLSFLHRRLEEVADANSRPGGVQAIADRVGHGELLWQLTEAEEFAAMMPWLLKYPTQHLTPKLREALEGPPYPQIETPLSSRGRNIAFELNFASRMLRNNVNLMFLSEVDLAAQISGHAFLLQCKRPFSERKFAKALRNANRQLVRDLHRAPSPAWGVIAISVGRVLNPSTSIFIGAQRNQRDMIDQSLDQLIDRHAVLRHSLQEPRVIAVIFHIQTAAYYPSSTSSIATIQRGRSIPLYPDGTAEHLLAMRLTGALSRDGWINYS